MPLYNFARRYVIKPKRIRSFGDLSSVPDSFGSSDSSSDSDEMSKSFFDSLLTAQVFTGVCLHYFSESAYLISSLFPSLQWEDRMERGLFRYDVTACATKVRSIHFLDPGASCWIRSHWLTLCRKLTESMASLPNSMKAVI